MRFPLAIGLCVLATAAFAQESGLDDKSPSELRLLDTAVFGKLATEPIVLLEPPAAEKLDPETVMVDISKGKYFAATVRYPTTISFENARKSLNKVYGKWEMESFADDASMGLWRNEDDQFSIQVSQDGFTVTVIYIKFSMLTEEKIGEGFSRAAQLMDDESKARQAIGAMRAILDKGQFAAFYKSHCHQQLREQIDKSAFVEFMQSNQGKEVVELFTAVDDALEEGEDQDQVHSRYNERDVQEYEFVLVQAQREAEKGKRWHIELRKEDGAWKLKDFD